MLEKVEDRITRQIGLGEHQRISALHTDTNNWHLHVALNKVHPGTYRNVEPYYDKFKMIEACRELEQEFGLLPDNGIRPNRKIPINPTRDKETHSGTTSLISWIRENAGPEIKDTLAREDLTWPGLHKALNRYGLTIRPRGAGFVIQDLATGLAVKASIIDRNFSKKKIEDKLGAYQEPKRTGIAYEASMSDEKSNIFKVRCLYGRHGRICGRYKREGNRILPGEICQTAIY